MWQSITERIYERLSKMNVVRMSKSRGFSGGINTVTLGAKLIYLPPYSPDYNPIEEAFSALKAFLRQHEDYASTDDSRVRLIKEGLATMRRDDIEGWFRHSGYM